MGTTWPVLDRIAVELTREPRDEYGVDPATFVALERDLNAWAWAHECNFIALIRDGRRGVFVRGTPVFCHE
jgi:hypothetical protein